MDFLSELQRERYNYIPKIPLILEQNATDVVVKTGSAILQSENHEQIQKEFPLTAGRPELSFIKGQNEEGGKKRRVGVLLSGGQAPGGHNVIAGIFDALRQANPDSPLYGFHLGPGGLVKGDYEILEKPKIDEYRNTGGFDIIGSGRTKIETEDQIAKTIATVKKLRLDALIIIGGDDSNTNAAFLAECFEQNKIKCCVIGVPKTIDGDLKNKFIETSFGFDTATKVYSALIGSLSRDTMSSKKYWNFVKLMGRSASHIALECALQVHPNVTLIGEEIAAKNMGLAQILHDICSVIAKRAEKGLNFGTILIPEGIVEFIPETANLINELNRNWVEYEKVFTALTTLESKKKWLKSRISSAAFDTLELLPPELAEQFLGLRDPHGNIIVSQIETEKLFIIMCKNYLETMQGIGTYKGKFSPMALFYGYEGRSVFPSNFDCNYCYALGKAAFLLAANNANGYITCIKNLASSPDKWLAGGVPLTMMMGMETRKGKLKPVVSKSLVDITAPAFKEFEKHRGEWAVNTDYRFPGPIQYYGPPAVSDRITETLRLDSTR